MKLSEVNPGIVGRRVSCIENGTRVTGTIIGVSEDKYTINVKVKFDEPLHCWSGDFNIEEWVEEEYESWARKSDGWGNLQYMYFIDNLDWLEDYRTKSSLFTDEFEIKEVSDNLGLEKKTDEQVQETRDNVVVFYSKLIKKAIEEGDQDKRWELSNALMSVTEVIDSHKWNRGMHV